MSTAINEIVVRAEAIGLSMRKLALRAELAPMTAYRLRRGDRVRDATLARLRRALEAIEAERRALLSVVRRAA